MIAFITWSVMLLTFFDQMSRELRVPLHLKRLRLVTAFFIRFYAANYLPLLYCFKMQKFEDRTQKFLSKDFLFYLEGLGTHLFVKVRRPEDSEVIFSVFESSCHLLLPV